MIPDTTFLLFCTSDERDEHMKRFRTISFGILCLLLCLCAVACTPTSDSERPLQAVSETEINTDNTDFVSDSEPDRKTEAPSDFSNPATESSFDSVSDSHTESTDTTGEPSLQPPPTDVHTHIYEKTVVASTCTKKGYTLNKCACGESYKSSYKNKIDHTYGDWTVTIRPSYFGEGKESRFCTFCGKEESVVLPIIPHYTCEERGIDVYEVQRLALEYIETLEDAIADPTLIGSERGGMAGWTLRIFTYAYETQEELLEHVKSALLSEYKTCMKTRYTVSLHALLEEDPDDPGDYVFYILYN